MLLFLISAVRAIVEMSLLCLLGQALLYTVAGPARGRNPIYRLFATITRPLLALTGRMLPLSSSGFFIAAMTFVLLLVLWVGLAVLKKSI